MAFNYNIDFDMSGQDDMNLLVAKFWEMLKVSLCAVFPCFVFTVFCLIRVTRIPLTCFDI